MKKIFLIVATSSILFTLKAQKQELLEVNYILNIDVNISNFAKQNGIDENDTSLINALLQVVY